MQLLEPNKTLSSNFSQNEFYFSLNECKQLVLGNSEKKQMCHELKEYKQKMIEKQKFAFPISLY